MDHKHLLVNSTFKSTPFRNPTFTSDWIRDLVDLIDMKILYAPRSVRCDKKGNEGISSFCLITTSHIALHSWEKTDPNLVQLDIYSCKPFDHFLVLEEFKKFEPISLGCKYLDRSLSATEGWIIGDETKY
jgi:S-adenosylmethionine/arginine decarboxylase-like enzyme